MTPCVGGPTPLGRARPGLTLWAAMISALMTTDTSLVWQLEEPSCGVPHMCSTRAHRPPPTPPRLAWTTLSPSSLYTTP